MVAEISYDPGALERLRASFPAHQATLNERYFMDASEIQAIDKDPLIEIGGHTISHPLLRNLTDEEAYREIVQNKKDLENLLDHSVEIFAYPFGNYDEQTIDVLKRAGITHQFCADGTQKSLSGCDDRLTVNPYISIHNQLRALAHGRY